MRPSPPQQNPLRVRVAETRQEEQIYQLLQTGRDDPLGHVDIRYAVEGQSFDVRLHAGVDVEHLKLEELHLDPPRALQAIERIELEASPAQRPSLQRLREAPVSPIGWMEGCMLEGLQAAGVEDALLQQRLQQFIPAYGAQQGLEGSLPAACLASLDPEHPWLDDMLSLWMQHRDEQGRFLEGGRIVAESCLTLAYPLARMARIWQQPELADLARGQVQACTKALLEPGAILLRRHLDGQRIFPNWSRALGWFLLGQTLTLQELEERPPLEALEQALDLVLALQAADGLWRSFADDPDCLPESSGSCAIAAALFRASELLPHRSSELRKAGEACREGIRFWVTADGFIHGATQHNCGGEALQRGSYRVIHPYVLGLYFMIPPRRPALRDSNGLSAHELPQTRQA